MGNTLHTKGIRTPTPERSDPKDPKEVAAHFKALIKGALIALLVSSENIFGILISMPQYAQVTMADS